MRFFLGLDLGQASDPTAVAVCERVVDAEGAVGFDLRHLERVKLGTPYPEIVKRTARLLATPELSGMTELVVDATGVGRPVVDMFIAANMNPVAVTITGGNETTCERGQWRVPKRDLVVGLQVALQSRALRIAEKLKEGKTLKNELLNFKVKIDARTAHDSYNAREGEHDDLVLAAALACWRARQFQDFVILT